jgi:hypothetical protein
VIADVAAGLPRVVVAVDWPHRRFVAPTMLLHAADAAVMALRAGQ